MGNASQAARDLTRRAILRAGRNPTAARLLALYQREGLVPVDPAESAARQAELDELTARATAAESAVASAQAQIAQLLRSLRNEQLDRASIEGLWDTVLPTLPAPDWEQLTEVLDDHDRPPLDRSDVDIETLTEVQRQWREDGVVIKRGFVPDDLIDAYWDVRSKLNKPHGWETGTPYLHVPEVLDLAAHRPVVELLEELIGEPMAISLNLTGLVSTERNWHQDDYLNPPATMGWYAAIWVALGDTDPDSGPFQYVPGSHRGRVLRRERVRMYLSPEERAEGTWPRTAERFVDRAVEDELARQHVAAETFIGQKGDILVWHSCLLHRGSPPAVPGRQRLSFIAHYHGLSHWALGPRVGHHPNGTMFFLSDEPFAD